MEREEWIDTGVVWWSFIVIMSVVTQEICQLSFKIVTKLYNYCGAFICFITLI